MTADPRIFVTIPVGGQALSALSKAQRSIQHLARERGAKVELLPRRHLHIILDDLGAAPPNADEAVQLAIERLKPHHPPFNIQLAQVSAAPNMDAPQLIVALIRDEHGRLAELRAQLHEALIKYGFELDERPYRPHVTLARVSPDFGPLPGNAVPPLGLKVRVRHLELFKRVPIQWKGPRYRRLWIEALTRTPQTSQEPQSEHEARAELSQALDDRIAQRGSRPTPRRRRVLADIDTE